MRGLVRWTVRGLAVLVGLAVLAVGGLIVASQLEISKRWTPAPVAISAAAGPEAVARGERLATVFGCTDCHGKDLRGTLYFDEPMVARLWAANLTLDAAEDSDSDIARAIRTGVVENGRALIGMPSEAFSRLSDAEVADLIAFIRSKPRGGVRRPGAFVGPVGRLGVITGRYMTAPRKVAEARTRPLPDFGPSFAEGRNLARACSECHGPDLNGDAIQHAPDLVMAASYTLPEFERLLRTGVATQGRRLGLMTETAPGRFAVLSDDEIAALHAYLTKRAEMTP